MTSELTDRMEGPPALELRRAWRHLQRIPNVGPATATDLLRLGVRCEEDLAAADPDDLYRRIGELDGRRNDPCVRDVFAAAIAFARGGPPRPWWHFTKERKRSSP